jgi:PAS domain S-box-containing protein
MPAALPPHPHGRPGRPAIVADDLRRCVDANGAALRLTGLTREQLLGRPIDEIAGEEVGSRIPALWWTLVTGGSLAGRLPIRTADGEVRVEFSAVANVEPGRHVTVLIPAGAAVRSADLSGRRPLSLRELEVLELVARGATSGAIAEELLIGATTVETHVRRCICALGASNRTHAVALAIGRGLIEAPRG